jgi:hypothetical protein
MLCSIWGEICPSDATSLSSNTALHSSKTKQN